MARQANLTSPVSRNCFSAFNTCCKEEKVRIILKDFGSVGGHFKRNMMSPTSVKILLKLSILEIVIWGSPNSSTHVVSKTVQMDNLFGR